jgi:hypothetical protein
MSRAVNLTGFVNVHGQPIVNDGGASFKRRPKPKAAALDIQPADATPQGKHLGWQALGFSPSQINAARGAHDAKSKEPFDETAWMNGAMPKPARTQPYSSPTSARQCAALLEKAGWKRVTVTEVIKK